MNIPSNAQKIEVENSTVEFFLYEKNSIKYYYFDTSSCAAPEPMINAMAGLKLINDSKNILIMINHQIPTGLFPRIENSFDFEIERLEKQNNVLITFSYKQDSLAEVDFNNNQCLG